MQFVRTARDSRLDAAGLVGQMKSSRPVQPADPPRPAPPFFLYFIWLGRLLILFFLAGRPAPYSFFFQSARPAPLFPPLFLFFSFFLSSVPVPLPIPPGQPDHGAARGATRTPEAAQSARPRGAQLGMGGRAGCAGGARIGQDGA